MNLPHEKDLTSKSADIISKIKFLDDITNLTMHSELITLAKEFAEVVRDFNTLVKFLRARGDDPSLLPEIEREEPTRWEN